MTNPSTDLAADPSANGRGLWWGLGVVAAIAGLALGAAIGGASLLGGFAVAGLMSIGIVRAASLRPAIHSALEPSLGSERLAIRVSLIGPKLMEPLWSRAQGVLCMQDGRTIVTADDGTTLFDVAADQYTIRAGSGWGKGGVWLEPHGQAPVRISFVTGADVGAYGAPYMVDKPLIPTLEQVRRAGATVATPPGWFDDPTRVARLRWWDGQRWTDQTTD